MHPVIALYPAFGRICFSCESCVSKMICLLVLLLHILTMVMNQFVEPSTFFQHPISAILNNGGWFHCFLVTWLCGRLRVIGWTSAWVQCYLQARKMNHAISQETIYRASIQCFYGGNQRKDVIYTIRKGPL